MKTAKVKYLLHSQDTVKNGEIVERFLLENEADLKQAWKEKLFTYHGTYDTILYYLHKGEKVIMNEAGGWCPAEGTWEILPREKRFVVKWEIDEYADSPLEAIRKAIEALPHEHNEDTLATVFDVEELDENGKVVSTSQIDVLEENPFELEN